jgi:hypothetical protein
MNRRNFVRKTISGGVAFLCLPSVPNASTDSKSKSTIKDHLWLWGQNAGSHHKGSPEGGYRLPGKNLLGPREGADYFGIERMLRVSMSSGPFPPFDEEAEKIKDLKEVVWSAIGAGGANQYSVNDHSDIDEVLRMAGLYKNVSGAVLDDFFYGKEISGRNIGRHSIESIRSMRDKLHNFSKRRLDLWMVWYDYQLDFAGVDEYLSLVDVITFWTWEGKNLSNMDENIRKCLEKTPGKRHLAGCYLWNYGERKPLTTDQMKYQLDHYYNWLRKGYIDGIIFCSNATVPDVGLDTAEYTRKWISDKGREKIKI